MMLALGLATVVAAVPSCGEQTSDATAPRLLSAFVEVDSASSPDGVSRALIELELDGPPPCQSGDVPIVYGILLAPAPSDDAEASEPLFEGLEPAARISARCEDGELFSATGTATFEPDPETEDSTRLTISAVSDEFPTSFVWFAFVATDDELQRIPAAPQVETAIDALANHFE